MKVKLLISVISAIVLSASLAHAAMPPKPAKCPATPALQSVAFELTEQDQDGSWAAGVMHNKYGTNDSWTFVIGKIQANSDSDARAKAVEASKTLKLQQGPLPIEQYGVWACVYGNAKNYPAITVTPALGRISSATTLLN